MNEQWTLKKKLILTFAAILLISGSLMGVALVNISKLMEIVGWNTHTYKVMLQSDAMLLNMVNIETGLRGYVASYRPMSLSRILKLAKTRFPWTRFVPELPIFPRLSLICWLADRRNWSPSPTSLP